MLRLLHPGRRLSLPLTYVATIKWAHCPPTLSDRWTVGDRGATLSDTVVRPGRRGTSVTVKPITLEPIPDTEDFSRQEFRAPKEPFEPPVPFMLIRDRLWSRRLQLRELRPRLHPVGRAVRDPNRSSRVAWVLPKSTAYISVARLLKTGVPNPILRD
jgi:hypothetical protein